MSKYKIPFVDFPEQYRRIKPEIDKTIQKCLDNGDFIMREDLAEFEKSFAKFIGVKHAIGTACGTDALKLSLVAAGIGPGDEVITVSETFVATISMIKIVGAEPVLVDVCEDLLMDVRRIEGAITEKTKAIIPVHLAGAMCDMERIMEIAKSNNLIVIEDACQALGAEQNGKKAGSWGLTGCWSFYPAKLLGCYGDGGAITTNDDDMAEKIRLLRDAGREGKSRKKGNERILLHGYNSLLDNMQAAILNVKLKYLPEYIKRRQEIAKMYDRELRDLPIKLRKSQTYQDYIIRVEDRESLAGYLLGQGIEVLVREVIPNHLQKGLGLSGFTLPNTERFSKRKIRLPIAPALTNEQIQFVIDKIKEFYEVQRKRKI